MTVYFQMSRMQSSEASISPSAGGFEIPLQELPIEAEQKDFFRVIVANVRNPSKFFVQLESQHSALTDLMEALDEAMEAALLDQQFDPALPAAPIPGLFVAARWPRDEMWYRTKVEGIATNTHATLFFIDYGDLCEVEWKSVRLLPPAFQLLPAQALQARLLGVQPKLKTKDNPSNWGSSASKALQNATGNSSEIGVWALMTDKDRKGKMGLWLVDTANNDEPQGVWVHEQLLEQGEAQPCPADFRARQVVVKSRLEALVGQVEGYFKRKEEGEQGGDDLSRILCNLEQKLHHLEILANLGDNVPPGQLSTTAGGSEAMIRMEVKPSFIVEKHQLVLPSSGDEANFRVVKDEVGKTWVVGRDVSGLVAEWKGYDLFENRLKAKGLKPNARTLTQADDGFEDLRREGLMAEDSGEVLLYSLAELPLVLSKINQDAATVLAGFWNSTRRG